MSRTVGWSSTPFHLLLQHLKKKPLEGVSPPHHRGGVPQLHPTQLTSVSNKSLSRPGPMWGSGNIHAQSILIRW
jgi:hypothetical protein